MLTVAAKKDRVALHLARNTPNGQPCDRTPSTTDIGSNERESANESGSVSESDKERWIAGSTRGGNGRIQGATLAVTRCTPATSAMAVSPQGTKLHMAFRRLIRATAEIPEMRNGGAQVPTQAIGRRWTSKGSIPTTLLPLGRILPTARATRRLPKIVMASTRTLKALPAGHRSRMNPLIGHG